MKKITLTKEYIAIVDDEDFDSISGQKWHITSEGYAAYSRAGRKILMHRVINNTPKGMFTDHINGNRLDNRKKNLRQCTPAENMFNVAGRVGGSCSYKGVQYRHGKYIVAIGKERIVYYIGSYDNAEEAALAYNKKAIELFGNFAKLNKIERR